MGDGTGIPGIFVAFFVLVVVVGIGSTIWRVSTARRIARANGIDPRDATAVTLLDQDGLAATYVGAGLQRGRSGTRTTEERLADLEELRASGRYGVPRGAAAHPPTHCDAMRLGH